MAAIDPLTAGAVLVATAATDAVYVMFTSAVVARKRVPAATGRGGGEGQRQLREGSREVCQE